MRWTLYSLGGFVLLAIIIGLGLSQPIPGNLARYAWWRVTHSAERGSVDVEGVKIRYAVYGHGKPVLLLHGGLSNQLAWFSQIPWLVKSGHRVVAVDTRGHGGSELGEADLTYHQLAYDATRIMKNVGIERADIIGWSDGANAALVLARDWPQRVRRIVAISGNFDPSGLTEAAKADSRKPSGGLTYWLNRWLSGAGAKTGQLESKVKDMWLSGPRLTSPEIEGIQTPVLVIVGENDMVTLSHARRMAELLPRGQLLVIQGGGHATLITHAREVNQAIDGFLDKTSGEGS